jgi:hypothetical protein
MPENDEVMSKGQAEKYQHNLSLLAKSHVEEEYRRAFSDSALIGGKPPSPGTIQRLLCIWKVLWKGRDRR